MGMGSEVDIHTAHFHGHSFDYKVTLGGTEQFGKNQYQSCHLDDSYLFECINVTLF